MFLNVRSILTSLSIAWVLALSGGVALAQEASPPAAAPEQQPAVVSPPPANTTVSSPTATTDDKSVSAPQAPPQAGEVVAPAQSESTPLTEDSLQNGVHVHRLDLGTTIGFNNPGGIYGVEADFRLIDRVSVGLAGGNGAWGVRLTPQARLYPFGLSRAGLFLEGGLSVNLGGKATATLGDVVVQEADKEFAPVVNLSLGYRVGVQEWGWWAIRIGYGLRLKEASYTLRDSTVLDPLLESDLSASKPGGFLIGVSGGFAVL